MMSSVVGEAEAPTYEEYAAAAWPSLCRTAYLLTGNHPDAEDVAQQTLLRAYRFWSRVQASGRPEAYVRRMLTNVYLSSKRPKRHRLELLTDSPPEPHSAPHGPEDHLVLWPHVKALPPRQRAVVVLRYYEDLSEKEIADALGCSVGNVKSTAHRAIRTLRATLGDRPDADGEES